MLAEDVARKLLDLLPPVIQELRAEWRSARGDDLTIPQFRVLAAIFQGVQRPGELALWIGVSQAAISKMIQVLAERGLVERKGALTDRRHVEVALTQDGETYFRQTRDRTQKQLTSRIDKLSEKECHALAEGLATLNRLFGTNA